MEKAKRMAMLSDSHMYESQDPLHKDLTGKNTKGEQLIAKSMKENENRFILSLEEARVIEGIDFLFFGGDSVTGYGERGLIGPDSLDHISKFKKLMEGYFPGLPKKYMAGGHEVGYILPLSTDPEGGLSEKSIQVFEQNFNELFYSFTEGRYKFVVLSSDLELFSKGTEELLKRRKLQQEFYKDETSYTQRGQKVVIMIHDPDALVPMFPFLESNISKIERTFSGHQHAQWVNKIYPALCQLASSRLLEIPLKPVFNKFFPGKADAVWSYFSANRHNAHIWKSLNLTIIPAPGGMMGIGGGFLVADLHDEGIKVNKVKIPKLKS